MTRIWVPEQRKDIRYPGQTLALNVAGRIHPFIDISAGGLSFEGDGVVCGQLLDIRLYSVLDNSDAARVPCRVSNICGLRIGVSFVAINNRLTEFIDRHIWNMVATELSPLAGEGGRRANGGGFNER